MEVQVRMEIVPPPPKEPASSFWRFLCPHVHSEVMQSKEGVVHMQWVCGDCGSVERFHERPNPRSALVRHMLFQQMRRALPKALYTIAVALAISVVLALVGTRALGG